MLCFPDRGSRISTFLRHLCSNSSSCLAARGLTPGNRRNSMEGEGSSRTSPTGTLKVDWSSLPSQCLASSAQEPPRRKDGRPVSTGEGECFIVLPLEELQILCGGRAATLIWASRAVDMCDPVTGYGVCTCPLRPGESKDPWRLGLCLCFYLFLPSPPTVFSKMLEFQGLETSMHSVKAQYPQVNQSSTLGRTPNSHTHQTTWAQNINCTLKVNWVRPTEEKITYKLRKQNSSTIPYHRLNKLNISEK